MNNRDYDRTYQKVVDVLESGGFSWLVHEVAEQVSIGKVNVPFSKDNTSKLYKGIYNIEYTPQERLQLLIKAAMHVLVNTAAMEENMLSFFRQTSQDGIEAVEFYSELEENSIALINSEYATDQRIHMRKIEETLNALSREATKYEH
jgi:hypothetical protein